jgi:ABC-2 type transport system permease protein
LIFLILYIVFVKFLKFGGDIPHYPVYLLLGIVIWSFFSEMTNQSLVSVVGRGSLIRKIKIPRWIIVASSSISALINLFLNLLVVGVFLIINHVDLLKSSLWLPLILFEVYLFAVGISLLLSAAYVKYRDVSYIWEVVLQAGFYLTPIIYPLQKINNATAQQFILMNPMAQAIQDARHSVVTNTALTVQKVNHGGWLSLAPFIIVLIVLVGGVIYFRRESKYFAENI